VHGLLEGANLPQPELAELRGSRGGRRRGSRRRRGRRRGGS
jgi:hypothetical protein